MNIISLKGVNTKLIEVIWTLTQRDVRRSSTYWAISQLGYIMLALGIYSYRAALFRLITPVNSKSFISSRIRINYPFNGTYCWIFTG